MINVGLAKTTAYNAPPARIERLRLLGEKYHIDFSLAGQVGPSRSSHKLVALALQRKGHAAQAALVEALFHGHFEEGRNISDEVWLAERAVSVAGLEKEEVGRCLGSEEAGLDVDSMVQQARIGKADVLAVPCVTVQGRFRIGGFQETPVLEALFDRMWKEGIR